MGIDLDIFTKPITLCYGHGEHGKAGCWMDALSVFTGAGKWTDALACVSPPINRLCIAINDALSDADRNRVILPIFYAPLGTAGDAAADVRRMFILVDAAVRRWAPLALEAAGLKYHANRLRAMPPVVDGDTARAANETARDAALAASGVHNEVCSDHVAEKASCTAANAAIAAGNAAAKDAKDDPVFACAASRAAVNAVHRAAQTVDDPDASDAFVEHDVVPVLLAMIEAGPHAPREEVRPACTPQEFHVAMGVV